MNRNSWIAIIVILLIVIIGVSVWKSRGPSTTTDTNATGTSPTGITTVRAFGQATLKLGETASFRGITITPLSVVEDSRCPEGVQCIQAGTVRVNVKSDLDSGASRQDVVKLGATTTIDTFGVTLVSVSPLKKQGSTIANGDYSFVFEVRESPVTDNELIGK